MNFANKHFLFLIVLLFFAFSCKKPVVLPPEPVIEFVGIQTMQIIDDLGNSMTINEIEFSLIDGDGDIGNDPSIDTTRNVFIKILKKEDGLFSEYQIIALNKIDTIPLEYIMPQTPISGGVDKSLQAHVFITLETFNLLPKLPIEPLPFDTLKYELFIKDRANNESNIIQTTEIVIPRNQ